MTDSPHTHDPEAASRGAHPRDLEALGFAKRFRELFAPLAECGLVPGRVGRVDRGLPLVFTESGATRAEPAAHLRESQVGPIAIGDWVALARPEGHDVSIVEAILPRSSAFTRQDPGEPAVGQVIAANIDTVFVVQALSADRPNLSRLERELVLAWESGATPAVVLAKSDLCPDPDAARDEVAAVALGVNVLVTSALTGHGVDALRDLIEPGLTTAFLGASGVGKSTLLNSLMGGEVQRTAEVRAYDGKGRHTTVAREMFFLPTGGIVIDTPGMRTLALWNAGEGMTSTFPDIDGLAERCRFADCAHLCEPGCAVRVAVERGEVPKRRLESYQRLTAELASAAQRQDVRARSVKAKADQAAQREAKHHYRERSH
ncbi:MAG TPA: ribosome small subunit-dependent GTPase A [Coriobacteriia bacterium]|nr:ribosome small subunit-dependent GTPase A [Coriobacteriia bacterium]